MGEVRASQKDGQYAMLTIDSLEITGLCRGHKPDPSRAWINPEICTKFPAGSFGLVPKGPRAIAVNRTATRPLQSGWTAPLALSYMGVNFFRLASNARIWVACEPSLSAPLRLCALRTRREVASPRATIERGRGGSCGASVDTLRSALGYSAASSARMIAVMQERRSTLIVLGHSHELGRHSRCL
jgi:hypothetical protein